MHGVPLEYGYATAEEAGLPTYAWFPALRFRSFVSVFVTVSVIRVRIAVPYIAPLPFPCRVRITDRTDTEKIELDPI